MNTDNTTKKGTKLSALLGFLSRQNAKLHFHPISVHVPNGVLPVALIFLVLGLLFKLPQLEKAAFYNLIFVLLTMPVVLLTGFIDWKGRFKGKLTKVFKIKMACGALVLMLSFCLVAWRIIDPDLGTAQSAHVWLYLLLHVVLLAIATVAGYYGGKLVFRK